MSPRQLRPFLAGGLAACGLLVLHACTVARSVVGPLPPDGFSLTTLGCTGALSCAPIPELDAVGYRFDPQTLGLPQPCASSGTTGCADLALDAARAPGARVSDGVLRIARERHETISLDEVAIEGCSIELTGPVLLRIGRNSRLERVRIRSTDDHPSARVEITDGQLSAVSVEMAGAVSVTRASVEDVSLRASDVSLTTVDGARLDLTAQHLNTASTDLSDVTLSVATGTVASSTFSRLELSSCDALTLLVATIERARLSACTEALHLEASSVTLAEVQGPIVSETVAWQQVRFGTLDATTLACASSALIDSTVCADTTLIRFGPRNGLVCFRCGVPTHPPVSCLEEHGDPPDDPLRSSCPAFQHPQPCAEIDVGPGAGEPAANDASVDAGAAPDAGVDTGVAIDGEDAAVVDASVDAGVDPGSMADAGQDPIR